MSRRKASPLAPFFTVEAGPKKRGSVAIIHNPIRIDQKIDIEEFATLMCVSLKSGKHLVAVQWTEIAFGSWILMDKYMFSLAIAEQRIPLQQGGLLFAYPTVANEYSGRAYCIRAPT